MLTDPSQRPPLLVQLDCLLNLLLGQGLVTTNHSMVVKDRKYRALGDMVLTRELGCWCPGLVVGDELGDHVISKPLADVMYSMAGAIGTFDWYVSYTF
jgi:hypothetical protein